MELANYSIGDKIDTINFISENRDNSIIVVNKSKLDSELTVFTWHDTIVWIRYSFKTKKEFESSVDHISSYLNIKPEYRIGESRSGLNFKGNEYFWKDSVSGDEISLLFYEDSAGRFTNSAFIENNEYIKEIVPQKFQIEIKFIVK